MLRWILCISLLATLTATVEGWAKYFEDEVDELEKRGGNCLSSGGKCYSTGQCCKGYVCAAFDDIYGKTTDVGTGMKPEVPGYCVHEKNLQACSSNRDCDSGARCVRIGRNREYYCVEKPRKNPKGLGGIRNDERAKGGLGSTCENDDDCTAFTKDGKDRLCCQDVRRVRQKTKRMCDRVSMISRCIEA